MKQNLLKTMLFSAALVAGSYGGVKADNVILQPTDDTYLAYIFHTHPKIFRYEKCCSPYRPK